MRTIFSRRALIVTALPIFTFSVPALAQTAPSDELDSGKLEDIVVTAQRRSERLQDVPVSVSAISSDQAAAMGITDTKSLVMAVPGLDFSTNGPNGAAPFLRGVGSASSVGGQESPVAIFVDGVYIYAPAGNLQSLPYIERIEVLKGPQGTLFGRNATAGVIQIVTRDPANEPRLEASAGYANYDTFDGSLYASTPLSETLSANLVMAGSNQKDGWGTNIVDGREVFKGWNWSVRSKLQWEPSPETRVVLAGDYSERRDDFGVNFAPPPGNIGLFGNVSPGKYNSTTDSRDVTRATDYGMSLRVEQGLGQVKLLSISAYRHTRNQGSLDQEGTPVPLIHIDLDQPSEQLSQELQLQSDSNGPFKWVLGTYYIHASAAYDPLALDGLAFPPGGAPITVAKQKLNSISAFAQGTYEIVDNTNLTVGLRYNSDKYNVRGKTQFDPGFSRQSDSSSKLTYRIAIDHKLGRDVLIYGSHSRGFKSGAFNTLRYDKAAVSPETLDATEIGFKSEFFDHTVRFNVAAYHYDYKNLQVLQIAVGAAYAINAGKARINGIDVDLAVTPVRNLTLTGGLAIADGKYTSFPSGTLNTPSPGSGNIQTLKDLSGFETIHTPDVTAQFSVNYDIDSSIGKWSLSASYSYNDGYFQEPDNRLRQPSYNLVNAGIGWKSQSERFGVRVWAKNLFNELYYSFGAESPFGDQISPSAPRTYGITLTTKM